MSHIFLPYTNAISRYVGVTSNYIVVRAGDSPNKCWPVQVWRVMEPKTVDAYPTRQWSCSSLMRGASFLKDQQSLNRSLSYEEIVGVTRLHSYIIVFYGDICQDWCLYVMFCWYMSPLCSLPFKPPIGPGCKTTPGEVKGIFKCRISWSSGWGGGTTQNTTTQTIAEVPRSSTKQGFWQGPSTSKWGGLVCVYCLFLRGYTCFFHGI